MDEFARIRQWTADKQAVQWQRERGVVIGIGDDAAVVQTKGNEQWVVTTDTMVENVHFSAVTMSPADIGFKALASNVSDIVAMGASPRHAVVAVSVPPTWDVARMEQLYDGLYDCAAHYGVAIIGGDTTSSPHSLVVTVTVLGTVAPYKAITRAGAKPGDVVFVTGPLGMAAAGLHALLAGHGSSLSCEPLVRAHQRPMPSLRAGQLLVASDACTSLNDVSDGLASEAWEIAEASGVRLTLHEAALPLSGHLATYAREQHIEPVEWMLYGGEDYVLVGTVRADVATRVQADFHAFGVPFYTIGHVTAGQPAVELLRHSGRVEAIMKRGYNHFSGNN